MVAVLRSLVAFLLVLEVLNSTLYALRIVSVAPVYGVVVLAMVGLRIAVTALQATAGWQLLTRAPSGLALARLGFAVSAVVIVLELGFRLAPSNVLPGWRYPTVAAYCTYAVVVIATLKWIERREELPTSNF
jgi:hypothetical protein